MRWWFKKKWKPGETSRIVYQREIKLPNGESFYMGRVELKEPFPPAIPIPYWDDENDSEVEE